jgi:16S rRNA (cytosine1402-N4)-methyltransferase
MDAERMENCSAESMDGSSPSKHIPVLAGTLSEHIHMPSNGIFVDVTVGQGGHSRLFGSQLGPDGLLIGLDVDKHSLQAAGVYLAGLACKVVLQRENFSRLDEVLSNLKIEKVDGILADLGFCSAQVMDAKKGMSFQVDAPLDMRLDDRLSKTAADIVNKTDEKKLADLIFQYGQERASRKIARWIANRRVRQRILTTGQLAAVVCEALHQPAYGRHSKIHPATRTFQALRIAVNDELENLKRLLQIAPKYLKKGGLCAILSFHSLEDGIVKEDFKGRQRDGVYKILTKKPLTADTIEVRDNPRSRSAKLRIAERI